MPRDQADASYLWDMLDSAQAIIQFSTGRNFDDYLNDRICVLESNGKSRSLVKPRGESLNHSGPHTLKSLGA